MDSPVHYEVLRFGSLIFLVNCVVTPQEIQAGFGFFEANIPLDYPLRKEDNQTKVAHVFTPEEAKNSHHPVVLGDFDSPIILKRIS
ncbi:hypothetical protein U2F10_03025 [Leptothoe sp. EHU-05/26/07-4]